MSDEFNFEQFNFEPGECQDTSLGLVTLPPISGAEGGPPSCPCGWGPNGIPQTNSLGIYQATWQPYIISTNPVITVEHTHPACMTWYDYILQGPSYLDTIPMNPCWQEYLTMPFCIDHANGNNWAAAIGAGWANCRLASDLQAMTNQQRQDIFNNTYSAFGPNGWTNPSHTLGVHPGTPPTAWIPVFIMNSFGLPSNQPNPLPPHQNGGWAVPAMRWFKIDATGSMNYQACFLENLACPNTCLGCTDLTSTTCITNPGACQAYDPTTSYFWPDLSSYPVVGWPPSSMDCCVSGCTTPGDPNYNPLATCDDGSCFYGGPIYGCMDPNAVICSSNPACSAYDSAATIDDGTCCIQGCTNSNATNYNTLANCDDGSCVYPPVPGCMDSNAINYMDCCDLTIPGCVPTIQYDACCKYMATHVCLGCTSVDWFLGSNMYPQNTVGIGSATQWNSTTKYNMHDIVQYTDGGGAECCYIMANQWVAGYPAGITPRDSYQAYAQNTLLLQAAQGNYAQLLLLSANINSAGLTGVFVGWVPCYSGCPSCPNGMVTLIDPNWGHCVECIGMQPTPSPWPTITGINCECCDDTPIPEKTKCHCCNKFGQAVMPNNNDYTDCSTLDGTLNTPATGMYNCVPVSQTLNCKKPLLPTTIEYNKKISEDTRDGVYFRPSGEEWSGPTHRMPGGMLMSGNPHDIDGSGSEGRSEILTEIYIVYLTPSGKQWCGDMHESMLGTIMSGKERNVWGSGPDGKSELLSKNTIKNTLSEYKSCKTDDPTGKPSWNCTSIGCMLQPPWWTPGQFTGPNAYADCMTDCTSWECASYTLFPPFNFELCLCFPVHGTGATQTYPTSALCQVAATTDPCCTDDYNTYNCTINGCEVHTGPGFGTYSQSPYALYECQQDCVAWGCYDVVYSSADTTTGYSFTDDSTAHTYTITGWTADIIVYDFWSETGTTLTAEPMDICIEAWYDITSMNYQTQQWAEAAIDQWMINEQQPGGMLEFWTGTFLNHRQVDFNTPWGANLGEKYLRWPKYTLDAIDAANGDTPGTNNPNSQCRNVLVIAFIDESNSDYYSTNPYWVNIATSTNTHMADRQSYINKHNQWTSAANGGTLQYLIYPALACRSTPSCYVGAPPHTSHIKQIFEANQGWKLNTGPPVNTLIPESGNNVLTYANGPVWSPSSGPNAPINGNIYEITDYAGNQEFLYGNPGQFGLPGIWSPNVINGPTPGIGCDSFVHLGCPGWHVATAPLQPGQTDCSPGGPSAPYTPMNDPAYNDYVFLEPLENYNVWAQYDRRQTCPVTNGVWNVDSIGPDLNLFMAANVMTGTSNTYGVTITNLGPEISSTTVTLTTASTYTAVTSNTVTVWWTGLTCLSAETIQTPDYPYLLYSVCIGNQLENNCMWPGISCGVDGCYSQMNGTWVDDPYGVGRAACEAYCRSWSCDTRNLGIIHEGLATGPGSSGSGNEPHHCHEEFPAGLLPGQSGINPSLYQPVTGDTYDFVSHCFNQFNAMTSYPAPVITGLVLGGLWDNIGTSFTAGFPNTTTQNGLVVHEGAGGNCETWHPQAPLVPGRITKLNGFSLVDLNGNNIYHLGDGQMTAGSGYGNNTILSVLEIIHQLENGYGSGWAMGSGNAQSPDFPNGMPTVVCFSLDQLIAYGNTNPYKKFTVEVWVYGCPCRHACWCKPVPGIDPLNPTTWDMNLPTSHSKCQEHCCDKYTTWLCPEATYWRDYWCNGCPNGGGCVDPLDGSGIHSTQADCEDVCELSWNCHLFDPISSLSNWNTPTTCPDINYYLPYNVPEAYFKDQEPTVTQRGQSIPKGYMWGNKPFQYGNQTFHQLGVGVSNAFEAFIFIFDAVMGYHNIEFNQIGFWPGSDYDSNDIWCEYPNTGDKNLGMMDGYLNNEFTTMYCIDYELRVNKRPWLMTEDPMVNGIPHPLAYTNTYYAGLVDGAAEVCNRQPGTPTPNEEHLFATEGDPNWGHWWRPLSPLWKNTYTSVKELKDKIKFIYSQPDYVDPYGWDNYQLFTGGWGQTISKNEVNIGVGACHRLSGDLARLFNPGPNQIKCTRKDGTTYDRPAPSNGLKTRLQLKDFWTIGMFRQQGLGSKFTPYREYNGFNRRGESQILQNQGGALYSNVGYTNFMTLAWSNQQVKPANVMPLSTNNLSIGLKARHTQPYNSMYGPQSFYPLDGRFECQCYVPCYCESQGDLLGDHLWEQNCHHDCCPADYVEICCNTTPPQAMPIIVGGVVNYLSPYSIVCPPTYHQVSCPW